jgi:hypothetical protein
MTTIPPAAIPGPEKLPEQEHDEQQPDPFVEKTDRDGRPIPEGADVPEDPTHDTDK